MRGSALQQVISRQRLAPGSGGWTAAGQWRVLGTFNLTAGDANKVAVSRWTSGTGYVIADAIRVTRV